ncbi:MAG: DUF3108 domain-containing protein [Zetaproteobacteria bacterium]|nr:DUF3108 domain-containing protein [Zetaproteobacteria bacterium]
MEVLTYAKTPYQPGEVSIYKLYYSGIYVGMSWLKVHKPILKEHSFWQHFTMKAETGEWYESIFEGREFAMAYVAPSPSFAVKKFYMKQYEHPAFSKLFAQEKWLTFDHTKCQAHETVRQKGKMAKKLKHYLLRGSLGTVGATMKLRSLDYSNQKPLFLPVYSSGKNWELEVTPEGTAQLSFNGQVTIADKLALKSYIGEDLQQQGKLHIWIARNHPNRPILQVHGEIKIGSIHIELDSFSPGKRHHGPVN